MKHVDKLLYYPPLRRLTLTKVMNQYRLRCEFRQRREVLSSYPVIAIVDPANICNLRCPLCPTGQGKHHNRGYMKIDLFQKIMTELSPYLFEIWLYNWGEPFMNSSIFELIEISDRSNVSTTISTNLNYFPEGYETALIKSRLERLVISFDGASQESYSQYRRGGDLGRVIDNVKRIVSAKKSANSLLPLLKLQFLVNRFNEGEISSAEALAKDLEVGIEFKTFMFDAKDKSMRKKWEPRNKKFIRYNPQTGVDLNAKKYSCDWLWLYAVINWDGKVTPCCNWMEKGIFEFGDLKAEDFKDVWNNDLFVSARRAIAKEISLPVTTCHACLGVPPSTNEDKEVNAHRG